MRAAAALPDRFYLYRFRHELIRNRLEIGDNLGAGHVRRLHKARKTKALFGFLYAIVGV
jgi:hypothetical protein